MTEQTQEKLIQSILSVRQGYLDEGTGLVEINGGLCEDFAHDVMDITFGKGWIRKEGQHGWRTLSSEELYKPLPGEDNTIDAIAWDWGMLEKEWGVVVPEADRERYDAIVPQGPNHCWITLEGRHYDCEHPDGVESFFELNFFRRWLGQEIEEPIPDSPAPTPF